MIDYDALREKYAKPLADDWIKRNSWDLYNKDYSGPLINLDEFLAIGGAPATELETKERLEYALVCHEAMPAALKVAMIEWLELH